MGRLTHQGSRTGHQVLSVEQTSTTALTAYPQPGAGPVSLAARRGYDFTTTSSESPFDAGTKDAIIYSITVSGPSSGDWDLELHGGTHVLDIKSGAANVPVTWDFGPEGLRIKGGFRVSSPGAITESRCVVTYDIE